MSASPTSSRRTGTSKKKDPRDTPAMRQYRRFKESHPDCLLFFRMGDFYEMFDDDAITAHQALDLTLTERSNGIPMAGVPFHAAENYLQRLIGQGFRVAVCDQIQDPAEAKGVVERAVTRVLTPGTLVDESLLDAGHANTTAIVSFDENSGCAVLASAELSTGRFDLVETSLNAIVDEVARLAPAELLISEDQQDHPVFVRMMEVLSCAKTIRPPWTLDPEEGARLMRDHWGVATLEGWGFVENAPAVGAAGGLLRFLLDTFPGEEPRLSHLQPPLRRNDARIMHIDASTLRNLEIERTMRTGGMDGSLLDALQCCVTSMGRRLLREWICWPSTDIQTIESRHDLVAGMLADPGIRNDLIESLKQIQDVARIAGRASTKRLTPRDINAVGRSIGQLPLVRERLEVLPAASSLLEEVTTLESTLANLGEDIRTRCVDDPPAHMREGGLMRDGVDADLDAARALQTDGSTWLETYREELCDETDIPSLKIGYNRVFGYYIEVTHAHVDRVPAHFVRKQTLKNAERYITDRLKSYEDEVLGAKERGIARELELFEEFIEIINEHGDALRNFAITMATIDVICCFAELAEKRHFVRPQMTHGTDLHITDARHPVLDAKLGSDFVPNDCMMLGSTGEHTPVLLITGPNMAGKSTYIRQVALITLMAQAGSFVPATEAIIGVVDRLFARIGASDELHAGMSTFMVEMTETANILHHATERSLVILDEIGRGTSTLDGLSLAWAITEALADRKSRTLFATHYHEITELGDRIESIGNRHVAVQEWDDRIVFLHRIRPGATNRSYGVHVGRLAGLPEPVINRARDILNSLEVQHLVEDVPPAGTASHEQMTLFTQYLQHPAIEKLREIDINAMTPLEAFDTLRKIVDTLNEND
ncbi:MAG: DNA mismatch repair protein MutS [Phycisphaerales bacterium]|nr:DNA mismatch repair protein MutS [Phycisphaerales bacterium]